MLMKFDLSMECQNWDMDLQRNQAIQVRSNRENGFIITYYKKKLIYIQTLQMFLGDYKFYRT